MGLYNALLCFRPVSGSWSPITVGWAQIFTFAALRAVLFTQGYPFLPHFAFSLLSFLPNTSLALAYSTLASALTIPRLRFTFRSVADTGESILHSMEIGASSSGIASTYPMHKKGRALEIWHTHLGPYPHTRHGMIYGGTLARKGVYQASTGCMWTGHGTFYSCATKEPRLRGLELFSRHSKFEQLGERSREAEWCKRESSVTQENGGQTTYSLNQSASSSAYALAHFLKLLSWVRT